ncbi:hypothetical protein PU02_0106 [Bartonella ancashensis]|uniref:Uncharacterized protein n=1 Tax=Bartonella ancashensis TaxID=1318743 RepID=A0A0M4L5Y5_9HYPH|nr:hypothetical protein PU02_0106 [Bartonella ancashensis]
MDLVEEEYLIQFRTFFLFLKGKYVRVVVEVKAVPLNNHVDSDYM